MSSSKLHTLGQQVTTILREKLVTVTGDLVVATARVRELELDVLDDKKSLRDSMEKVLTASTLLFPFWLLCIIANGEG